MRSLFTLHRVRFITGLILAWAAIAQPQTSWGHEGHEGGHPAGSGACETVTNLPPFLDPLPLPTTILPSRTNYNYCISVATNICFTNGIPEYDVVMTNFMHYFHTDLPPVEVWGYNGQYPGPTFDVTTNKPILVNWINNLPTNYPAWLPADTSFHGVSNQVVRSVVHLHGGATLPRYDGYPTNNYYSGESDQYFYGNIDLAGDGATLWYHDHALGVTANNVYAGLAGFYLLRNPAIETNLNLPKGKYEVPLVIQDRDVQTNCVPPSLSLGQYPWHALAVVNGKVTPYFEVEPRRYRFRILNGGGYRTFGLSLSVTDTNGVAAANAPVPPPYYIIGNDAGFLEKTVPFPSTNILAMMNGERVDMIIDFTPFKGTNVTMINTIIKANPPVPPFITNIMQFRVSLPLQGPDTSSIPGVILTNYESTASMLEDVVKYREVTLDIQSETPFPGPPFEEDGTGPFALLNMMFFHDPITDFPHAGDTEVWSFINLTPEAHPMHIHLLDFRIIDRIRFAGWNTNESLAFPPTMVTNYINDRINNKLKPLHDYLSFKKTDIQTVKDFEAGPKDVVRVAPFASTQIVMKWPDDPGFYSTPSASSLEAGTDGRYIYHCHILDHEDNDMMRPLQLLPPRLVVKVIPDPIANPGGKNRFKLGMSTRAGESYQIETTASLTTPNWQPITAPNIIGTGKFVHVPLPSATDQTLFYRARKVTAP